jgi:hypothetical protein
LHTKNELPVFSGSALKVKLVWCGPTNNLVVVVFLVAYQK